METKFSKFRSNNGSGSAFTNSIFHFPTMFSTLKKYTNLSSANAFNSVKVKILPYGKGLKKTQDCTLFQACYVFSFSHVIYCYGRIKETPKAISYREGRASIEDYKTICKVYALSLLVSYFAMISHRFGELNFFSISSSIYILNNIVNFFP